MHPSARSPLTGVLIGRRVHQLHEMLKPVSRTGGEEDAAALGTSYSNRTVFNYLSNCSSPASSDPLLPDPYDASAAHQDNILQCVRNVSRHNVESSGFNLWRSFNQDPW